MDEFDLDDLDSSATGGKLRGMLESALKEKRELAARLSTFEAKEAIAAGGFKHVTADDLQGIPSDQIAAKAAEVEKARMEQRDAVLRSVLAERGVPEAELEAAVTGLLGTERDQKASAVSTILSAGRVGGVTPQLLDPNSLTPDQMIRAGMSTTRRS